MAKMNKLRLWKLAAILTVLIQHVMGKGMFEVIGVSQEYQTVSCIVADRFVEGQALICAQNSVKMFNFSKAEYNDFVGRDFVRGYADGFGQDAKFNDVEDIYQLNETAMILTDHVNNCLRLVIDRIVTTYSGNCTKSGFKDGPLSKALFFGPIGFLAIGHQVFIAEHGNKRIRKINLKSSEVSTVFKLKNAQIVPYYLTCFDSCDWLYVSFLHGILRINRYTNVYETICGEPLTEGIEVGALEETEVDTPEDLLFINESLLLVADRNNNRVALLDLKTKKSRVFVEILLPWSLHLRGNHVYVGSMTQGLIKVDITPLINPPSLRLGHTDL